MVVSGLVDSPYYIGLDRGSSRVGAGSSQGFAYTMGDDIASLATRMPLATLLTTTYTQLWVKVEGAAELNGFASEYETYLEPVMGAARGAGRGAGRRRRLVCAGPRRI